MQGQRRCTFIVVYYVVVTLPLTGCIDWYYSLGLISGLSGISISHVTCGNSHSLALDEKGQVYSWGDGQYGQLGLGMATSEPKFTPR